MCSIPAHLTRVTSVKQSKKRVMFQPSVTVQPIDCSVTPEEKSRSYYCKDELNIIALKVKATHALSKGLRGTSSACDEHAIKQECMVGLGADPAIRGVELYVYPIRVRNQVLAQKTVLKYQQSLNTNPNYRTSEEKLFALASVSAKVTQWSSQVAVETARLDSLRAYEGDFLIPISEPVDISPFPVSTKKRRRVAQDCHPYPTRRRVTYDDDIQPEERIGYCRK